MRMKKIAFSLGLVTLLVVAFYFVLVSQKPDGPLPVLGQVSYFELTDVDEKTVTLNDLKGKTWVANFIFTSCQGPCPILTKKVSQLQKEYHDRQNVEFVTVTVDPKRDSPAKMKEYGERFGANFDQWYFLTGPYDNIKALMFDQMKLGVSENIMTHTERMVLLDGEGQIRGYYQGGNQDDFKALKRDLKKLSSSSI